MSDPSRNDKEAFPGSLHTEYVTGVHNGGFPHNENSSNSSSEDINPNQRKKSSTGGVQRYVDGSEEKEQVHFEGVAADPNRNKSVYSTSGRRLSQWEAIQVAAAGEFDTIDAEIDEIEAQLQQTKVSSRFQLNFKDPRHFTWLLVGFASMGGLLSGIDQSLISGANLYMPASLHLNTQQVSMVSSGVPLGAIGGAILLGPLNENFGRRGAIIISLVLYTVGGILEAAAVSYGMMVAARVILGLGVGLEGGTVPVVSSLFVVASYLLTSMQACHLCHSADRISL